jgi:radical SAM family RiPP maturation amino acid epimerase
MYGENIMTSNQLNPNSCLDETKRQLSVIIKGKKLDVKDFQDFCQIKRFYERWIGDKNFRSSFLLNPSQSLDAYKINVCIEDVRPLWDDGFEMSKSQNEKHSYFNALSDSSLRSKGKLDTSKTLENSRFQDWRDKQINRCSSQFHPQYHDAIGHYPVCFELSKGCSVGCWFCGISAPKLGDIFLHNEKNSILWKSILELVKKYVGDDANSGFCYWASDPLDNPDYEKFCIDFYEVLGKFPYTSTAQAHKYPERVKKIMDLSFEKGRNTNRFSVLSLKVLNQLHSQFTAEELVTVELAFQNPEALSRKASTGKASKINDENQESIQSSIACVTGFLFNMVECTVKLISPCPASQEWPDGYIVFDEGRFSNITELEFLIDKMISDQTSDDIALDSCPTFRNDLEYKVLGNGFQLSTRFVTYKFGNYPYIQDLGNILKDGCLSTNDIIPSMEKIGLQKSDTLYLLNKLSKKGVIENVKRGVLVER